jgi:SAM-dependent methyltransferase
MAGDYHSTRFAFDERREILWRTLCRSYFQRLVRPDFHVLELGAGYAHFINNIQARQKTAVDQWEGLREFASDDVRVHVGNVSNLDFLTDASVDFAFASNLFEHLLQPDFAAVLATLRRKLKPEGTLNILQPNYRRAYREYFDDYTHVAIYSDISLCDFLGANGYRVLYSTPGLLPLTVKSKFPIVPLLIKGYLASPWKPMAKQMFIRAQPQASM